MEHGGPGTPASTENEDVKKLRHDIECTQRTLEGLTQYCEELESEAENKDSEVSALRRRNTELSGDKSKLQRRLQSFSEESNLDDDGVGHRSPTSTTQRTEIIDGNSGTSTNDRSDSGAASGGRGAGLLANDHGGHHFAMLTSRAAMLEAELKQRDMEVARLHQLLEDYQLDDDALRTENDESLETELSTQELLEEERAESALLRDTVDEVTAMLQAAEDALEAYRQNDSQGESDGDGGLRRRRMTLADEMMDISDERAKATLSAKVASLSTVVAQLQQERDELDARLALNTTELGRLQQRYTALDAEKEKLEAQLMQETTDGRLATTLMQLDDAKQEARVLQFKIGELEKLCARLQQQVHRMGGEGLIEVSDLRKQNAKLKQMTRESSALVARAQAKEQSMRASHAFLTQQLAKAQLAAAGMAPEAWAVQGKLQDELKAAQQEVDDSAAHAAELQSKLGRSEVNRSVLQRKVDERDIDIAELRRRIRSTGSNASRPRFPSLSEDQRSRSGSNASKSKEEQQQAHTGAVEVRLKLALERVKDLEAQLVDARDKALVTIPSSTGEDVVAIPRTDLQLYRADRVTAKHLRATVLRLTREIDRHQHHETWVPPEIEDLTDFVDVTPGRGGRASFGSSVGASDLQRALQSEFDSTSTSSSSGRGRALSCSSSSVDEFADGWTDVTPEASPHKEGGDGGGDQQHGQHKAATADILRTPTRPSRLPTPISRTNSSLLTLQTWSNGSTITASPGHDAAAAAGGDGGGGDVQLRDSGIGEDINATAATAATAASSTASLAPGAKKKGGIVKTKSFTVETKAILEAAKMDSPPPQITASGVGERARTSTPTGKTLEYQWC